MSADATIPYLTPAAAAGHRPPARGWLATALLAGGLGLVFLAGCFLIGVMSIVSPKGLTGQSPPLRLTDHQAILVAFLYLTAGVCLVAAVALIVAAARTLLRLANG